MSSLCLKKVNANFIPGTSNPSAPVPLDAAQRDLVSRFLNPSAVKVCSSPLEVPYQGLKNQKANGLVLGSRTLTCGGAACRRQAAVFSSVREYFAVAWDYIRHKYPLENETLKVEVASLKCLGGASFKSHHFFIESFPQILPAGEE